MRIINSWTVIGEVLENQRLWYLVRCVCGYEGKRRPDHLESGRTKSCKSCSQSLTMKNHPNPVFVGHSHKGEGDLGRTYWGALQAGARKRGIDFEIPLTYAWSLFDGKCALSGVPITISPTVKDGMPDYSTFTASLDRKNSTIGYVEGNVQWVHKKVNRLKGAMPEDEFKDWCKLVAQMKTPTS